MPKGIYHVPEVSNEPVNSYAPGTPERKLLQDEYHQLLNQDPIDVPMYIGSEEIRTDNKRPLTPPHDHQREIGHWNEGDASHAKMAIDAALKAKKEWAELPWEQRAGVFLKAADLLAGPYRYKMNAATMLGQSKNPFQSEIDAVCE